DFYAPTRTGDHLMWTSPVLPAATHTFKLRVTGSKNAASSNTFVVPDRVDVTAGSSGPPPKVTTVDDPAFTYTGSGWHHCSGCGADLFNGTNSWDNTAGDTATVTFTGTRIAFYGVLDSQHGVGAVSVDGGAETAVDFSAAARAGNQLMWTRPRLPAGTHTFTLSVTGMKH